MKSVLLVIGAVIVILLSPASLNAINSFRLSEYTDTFVVTTAGVTTATVTLSQDLYGGYTYHATLSSNVTNDAPIPSSYVENTNVLSVSGLQVNTDRMLTVLYKIDGLEDDYYGAGVASRVWPIFLILGVIGIIGAAIYQGTRRGE